MQVIPKTKDTVVDTDWCKNQILAAYPQTKISDWPRTNKVRTNDRDIVRQFTNVKLGLVFIIIDAGQAIYTFVEPATAPAGNFQPAPQPMETQLIMAGNKIRHCGDYCHLYWNAKENSVWMCMGDGDVNPEQGYTSMEEIEKLFKDIGVANIQVEAESSPRNAKGWKWLKKCKGIAVNIDGWDYNKNKLKKANCLQLGFMIADVNYTNWHGSGTDMRNPYTLIHVRGVGAGYEILTFDCENRRYIQYDLEGNTIDPRGGELSNFHTLKDMPAYYNDLLAGIYKEYGITP